jgi:hypothetical protein
MTSVRQLLVDQARVGPGYRLNRAGPELGVDVPLEGTLDLIR